MLSLVFSVALMGQVGDYAVRYDEVRDATAESLDVRGVHYGNENDLQIGLSFHRYYRGRSRPPLRDEDDVDFMVFSRSTTWQFLKFNDAALLYDDVRMPLRATDKDQEVVNGGVSEIFVYRMTLGRLKEIAASRTVKLAIGTTSFTIPEASKALLREYLDHLGVSSEAARALEERKARAKAEMRAEEERRRDEQVRAQREAARRLAEADREEARRQVEAEEAEVRRRAEAEKAKHDDDAARKDIAMAERFIKIKKPKAAEEYLKKALDRKPSDEVRKKAEELSKKISQQK
ncbi:hypothetical protein [Paludisphaera mucosa]|uniref:Uncharacterized protein n=1 Tax=Paludisphaera mucosa TaxID=3030827 RepID=A0ABT6F4S0_9BACT|nr:hypothetical protein [Paludisphaera mucosa]MDG3002580.1 hypothetical protein [Paludisphaera mucosa]